MFKIPQLNFSSIFAFKLHLIWRLDQIWIFKKNMCNFIIMLNIIFAKLIYIFYTVYYNIIKIEFYIFI